MGNAISNATRFKASLTQQAPLHRGNGRLRLAQVHLQGR